MNIRDLQERLVALGYTLVIDGHFGPITRDAVYSALTDPADTPIARADVEAIAAGWGVEPAAVWAVRDVESTGSAFIDGRPTILFEPHRFSRATGHRFDKPPSNISYPDWDPKRYPGSQVARYAQLLKAIAFDVDAGFASASYGAFQILGENFAICGEPDSFSFALSEASGEGNQLRHFARFVENKGLVAKLRAHDWAGFARGYNGTAYAKNRYDQKLAAAFAKRGAA